VKLLLPRAKQDALSAKAHLQAMGHEVIVAPVFVFQALDYSLPENLNAVFATSVNALRALKASDLRRLESTPLYLSGAKTLQIAHELGFTKAEKLASTASELTEKITAMVAALQASVYLAGKDRTLEVQLFAPKGVITLVETYEMIAAQSFAPDVLAEIKAPQDLGVLLYSKRMARIFCALWAEQNLGYQPQFFCLSQAVADEVRLSFANATCVISQQADEESLFAALEHQNQT